MENQRKQIMEKLLGELYESYLKFKSSIDFYREKNNKELNETDWDKKREELSTLKAKKDDETISEDISEELKADLLRQEGMKVYELEGEIDYYNKFVDSIQSAITSANETKFHYDNILKLYNEGFYNDSVKTLE